MSTTEHAVAGRPAAPAVFAAVRGAVALVLECEPALLAPDTSFADLGADSLALVEIAEIIEERFAPGRPHGSLIPDDDLEHVPTLGAMVDLVLANQG